MIIRVGQFLPMKTRKVFRLLSGIPTYSVRNPAGLRVFADNGRTRGTVTVEPKPAVATRRDCVKQPPTNLSEGARR